MEKHHLRIVTTLDTPLPFKATLDLHSWLQRIAALTGNYEADTVQFLHRLRLAQKSRGYTLDIGANIGLLSIPIALMSRAEASSAIAVVSIEAVPDNCRILNENIALNNLNSEILVVETALGDFAKMIEIQVEGNLAAGEGTGTANILPEDSNYVCVRQTLQLRTLDQLSETEVLPSGCSVMKIDTDGYDLKVVQGGIRFLSKNRPVIFGEFSSHCMNWHNQSIKDVVDFAVDHNYDVWQRIPKTWKFTQALAPDTYRQDLLLVPQEIKAEFGWCLVSD
jgi:FkbM family methyltransferase